MAARPGLGAGLVRAAHLPGRGPAAARAQPGAQPGRPRRTANGAGWTPGPVPVQGGVSAIAAAERRRMLTRDTGWRGCRGPTGTAGRSPGLTRRSRSFPPAARPSPKRPAGSRLARGREGPASRMRCRWTGSCGTSPSAPGQGKEKPLDLPGRCTSGNKAARGADLASLCDIHDSVRWPRGRPTIGPGAERDEQR